MLNNEPLYSCGKTSIRSGLPAKVYLFAANVYPQDELRGVNKVELSPVHQSEGSRLRVRLFTREVKYIYACFGCIPVEAVAGLVWIFSVCSVSL